MNDPTASPPDPTSPETEVHTTSPLAARVPPAAEVLLTSPNQLYSERVRKLVCRLDRKKCPQNGSRTGVGLLGYSREPKKGTSIFNESKGRDFDVKHHYIM